MFYINVMNFSKGNINVYINFDTIYLATYFFPCVYIGYVFFPSFTIYFYVFKLYSLWFKFCPMSTSSYSFTSLIK